MDTSGATDVADLQYAPPQNIEAEQCVLGAMMLSKDAIADVVGTVRGEDFYRPAHETIFAALMSLYAAGEPVDAITAAARLTGDGQLTRIGGAEYLHTLIANVPSSASAGYYARLVREQATLRELATAAARITQTVHGGGDDVDEIVDVAQAEILAVTERRDGDDTHAIGDVMEKTLDQIDAAAKRDGGLTGIATGFVELDRLTSGLQPGNMIVVAARPAIGKSTFGVDIARAAAIRGGVATAIFTLEMTHEEVTKRILSAESGVPLRQLTKGPMGPHDWEAIAKTAAIVSRAPLFIDDSPHMTMSEIRAKCRRLKHQHNLGLVVVDYLQLMSSARRFENRQQEVAEFSRALKLLAKELGAPVVAISQLNRGPEQRADRKPLLSDMRESGSIEQDADVVLLLHRADAYDRTQQPGEATVIVAKNRQGPTDEFQLAARFATAQFTDMAQNL
jgi:replicative DNA helicase